MNSKASNATGLLDLNVTFMAPKTSSMRKYHIPAPSLRNRINEYPVPIAIRSST